MSKREPDILLIRKYLNGELNANAMHQFERRMQADPFLMDAVEGYENTKRDQQQQLGALSGRLHQRIAPRERRVISWNVMAIAATVLVVFTLGGLWLYNNGKQPVNVPKTAQVILPQAKQKTVVHQAPALIKENEALAAKPSAYQKQARQISPVTVADKPVSEDNAFANQPGIAGVAKDEAETTDSDSANTSLNELVVMGMAKKSPPPAKDKQVSAKEGRIAEANVNRQLAGKVAGLRAEPAPMMPPGYFGSSSRTRIAGNIVDQTDGRPLPGVSVKVAGTNIGALTNAEGKFSLKADSARSTLVIAYIGYKTLRVDAHGRDSSKTIALEPNSNSLSEVVVTNYHAADKPAAAAPAHPKNGWHQFKKYLKENAVSPDSVAGTVTLSFMIDQSGNISEVNIVKGLSPATNKKAIALITNGPGWTGNTNGQTEQVQTSIKFVK